MGNADLGNAILWTLAHLPDGVGKPHLEALAGRIDHPPSVKRIKAMAAKIKG